VNLRGRREREGPDIILTPLIDTMFLLVIFFMLSTSFSRHADISVELPEASAKPEASKGDRIVEMIIDARGQYYLDGRKLAEGSAQELRAALEQAAGQGPRPPLIISADANTPHHCVVTAMDAAQQAGFLRLSIATVQPP
jgi:biopolymer transport protein ExbD